MKAAFSKIEPMIEADVANVIIDTPKGSRNKYKWDEELGLFRMSHVLAEGLAFPFNFGFIPNTRGGDGDALDVMVLSEEPIFSGCLIQARLVCNIEAEQTQEGKTNRNDRLIGVAVHSRRYGKIQEQSELGPALLDEIEHFFIAYNEMRGRVFKPMHRASARETIQLVKESAKES